MNTIVHLLSKALEELLHIGGEVQVQGAEGPQHRPHHAQSQAVELGQLIQEQGVDGPGGRGGGGGGGGGKEQR